MTGQTKLHSLIESCVDIGIGFAISVIATMVILPALGYMVTLGNALKITVCFTILSLIRKFIIRRIFNGITVKKSTKKNDPVFLGDSYGLDEVSSELFGCISDPRDRI